MENKESWIYLLFSIASYPAFYQKKKKRKKKTQQKYWTLLHMYFLNSIMCILFTLRPFPTPKHTKQGYL